MRLFLASVFSCAVIWTASAQESAISMKPTNEVEHAIGVEDLADIMGATELRHLKLSYAGSVENWDLANYEVGQIKKSFQRAAKFYPVFETVPVAKLIAEISEPALAEVDKSIAARDADAFLKSFEKLTSACNSCHQAAKLGFIKMQVPTASPFSNQVFAPVQSGR